MGNGDWNDGMNQVGNEGRGEHLVRLVPLQHAQPLCRLCERHGHEEPLPDTARLQLTSQSLSTAPGTVNGTARLYDDARLWVRQQRDPDRLDPSILSVLSGGGNPQHAAQAMQSVLDRLVQHDERLVLLFTPPFNKTPRDPGYIKGYPPGVRENGGQYTHAALWSAWALLESGSIEEGFDVFQLLNPILHANTPEKSARYRVEPYVVAADVYGAPPFTGMGGWTWYTGSSGWMYRLALEGLLGLKKVGSLLYLNPHIPRAWTGFQVTYRFGQATYEIEVQNPKQVNQGVQEISLNGKVLPDKEIPLSEGSGQNQVRILMG
jgi:cyclic beta-1,2-glucan synthetase